MPETKKVILRVVTDAQGKKNGVCIPNRREDNLLNIGQLIRFEAEDSSQTVENITITGAGQLRPVQDGGFFRDFEAQTVGTFQFVASVKLPDNTDVGWGPGSGGEGEIQRP